ncbi:hypothetical protein BD310DRAFT_940957 [Dichomitus squalens]|uniref:Uncharacterized protein n=1 Tax=Dichomitus squalens TaxID=114155 RepID=A0A4Q9PGE1_9APHY|nr:hypothetical protein BD310DRAFT_940957 [Dichomitus squalens]
MGPGRPGFPGRRRATLPGAGFWSFKLPGFCCLPWSIPVSPALELLRVTHDHYKSAMAPTYLRSFCCSLWFAYHPSRTRPPS